MKSKVVTFILPLAFMWACQTSQKEPDLAASIHQVETSLCPPVLLVGDSTWTLEARMKKYGVPGVSLAVIRDYKILWSKAYGIMDKDSKEPVTTQTLFQAGSISKPVAAYGALHEVQQGKIKLEENVNTYLRSWKLPDNEFTKEKKVSLKNLLSHTGGITVHGFLGYSPDLPLPTLVQVLNGERPANSPPIRVDKVPGGEPRYSGGGYTIMQQMLIDTEGKPFPEIMNEQVLGPLGMTSSTYRQPLPPDQLTKAATGYLPNGTMTKGKRHTYPEMAAAGLWTTAEDLARFAIDVQLSLKGESNKVLSKDAVTRMLTPFKADDQGLGLFLSKFNGDVYFQHGGWDEGFSSKLIAHKEKGYGVVVLINSNQPDFIEELIRAVALTGKWDSYVLTYQPRPMTEAFISKTIGRYQNGSDDVLLIYRDGNRMFIKSLYSPPMEMFAISDSTFIRRERISKLQIKSNPADGKQYLVFRRSTQEPLKFENPRLEANDKVPYEWLLECKYEQALKGYQHLRKLNSADQAISEETLNHNGYDLLSDGKILIAKEMFKINMALYPASANVYDSYAEACLKNGEKDLAVINYKKSLALNPANEGAKKALVGLK